jgi:hypothetical protein
MIEEWYFSPLLIHSVILLIACLYKLLHYMARISYNCGPWMSLILFAVPINPFLGFFSDHFWIIWWQCFILGLPLLFLGGLVSEQILDDSYSNAAAGFMGAVSFWFLSTLTTLLIYSGHQLFNAIFGN